MDTNINVRLARDFLGRATEQRMTGKARDRAAIEFFCGAAAALGAVNNLAEQQNVLAYTGMVVCTRGAQELERLVQQADAQKGAVTNG